MSSIFSGYSIAVSGMMANKDALTVSSHNISNVNTAGYSRQRTVMAEVKGACGLGAGTTLEEITRARDQYLDRNYRRENAGLGYWTTKSANLTDIQEMLNELQSDDGTSDSGLQQVITDYFDSWDDLATDAGSMESRNAVLAAAKAMLDMVGQITGQLSQLRRDCITKVEDAVDELQDTARKIATLNLQIKQLEARDVEADDLRDQRDQLIDEISSLTNLTVNEQADGMVDVSIGGIPLVQGESSFSLVCQGDGSGDDPLTVYAVDFDTTVRISSGSIKAYLEEADQTGVAVIGEADIPYNLTTGSAGNISNMWQALNDMVTTLAYKVNELQTAGVDANGDAGIAFFTTVDATRPLALDNIQINPELDYNKISTGTTGESEDNSLAAQIAELDEEDCFQFDGLTMDLDNFYQKIISWLGTTGETAESAYDNQSTLLLQVDTQRQSLSAVSLDEEMSNMIMYQNIYSASAQVLSLLDSLTEELIEELG